MPRLATPSKPPAPPPKSSPPRTRNSNQTNRYPADPPQLDGATLAPATTPRDTATGRPDGSSRTRMHRSQTSGIVASPLKAPAPPTARRSYSQDNVTQTANMVEKARKAAKPATNKDGSTHADVIDRLDYTGLGSMFHHDGPFDACAPSRNRHKTKAPMLAWSGSPADPNFQGDSKVATRSPNADRRRFNFGNGNGGDPYKTPTYDSRYPTLPYDASGLGAGDNAKNGYKSPKEKEVDRIAEAWGIHEPEPYEDFAAGGTRNSGYINGFHEHEYMEHARDRDRRPPMAKRLPTRTNLPPPQPIFLPDASQVDPNTLEDMPPSPTSPSWYERPGAPKRSLSIMNRVRKMRENPNMPVSNRDAGPHDDLHERSSSSVEGHQYQGANSVPGHGDGALVGDGYASAQGQGRPSRPAHRSQNSFFGRFGRGVASQERPSDRERASANNQGGGGGRERSKTTTADHYVFIEDRGNMKALPNSPPGSPPVSPSATNGGGGGGGLFGRKKTIFRKVKGAVRNGNSL